MNRKRKIITIAVLLVLFLGLAYLRSRPDGLLHVIFCNVGQGDAIYIKLPDGKDILVDGGPGNKVLSCLGNHMAFWDRNIELIVLTHPHEDHFHGLIEVIKRYNVKHIAVPLASNDESESYREFVETVHKEKAETRNLYQGDRIEFNLRKDENKSPSQISFTSLWPTKKWVALNTDRVTNETVLGVKTTYSDLNDFSQVLLLSYGEFDVLLTGDAEQDILTAIYHKQLLNGTSIEVMKVPHQGNRNAVSTDLIKQLMPKMAVITVGKNSYGHPAPETLKILSEAGVLIKRTDKDGSIEILSDGKKWKIKD